MKWPSPVIRRQPKRGTTPITPEELRELIDSTRAMIDAMSLGMHRYTDEVQRARVAVTRAEAQFRC